MAYKISGIIQYIGDVENIPYQDKVFSKRELVLDCSYRNQFTGQIERANYPKFEFVGMHVNDLNNYKVGDIVTISFALSGSRSEKDGQVRYFTKIQGFRIEQYQVRYNSSTQSSIQGTQSVTPPINNNTTQSYGNQPLLETNDSVDNSVSSLGFPPAVNEQGKPINQVKDEDLPF